LSITRKSSYICLQLVQLDHEALLVQDPPVNKKEKQNICDGYVKPVLVCANCCKNHPVSLQL